MTSEQSRLLQQHFFLEEASLSNPKLVAHGTKNLGTLEPLEITNYSFRERLPRTLASSLLYCGQQVWKHILCVVNKRWDDVLDAMNKTTTTTFINYQWFHQTYTKSEKKTKKGQTDNTNDIGELYHWSPATYHCCCLTTRPPCFQVLILQIFSYPQVEGLKFKASTQSWKNYNQKMSPGFSCFIWPTCLVPRLLSAGWCISRKIDKILTILVQEKNIKKNVYK